MKNERKGLSPQVSFACIYGGRDVVVVMAIAIPLVCALRIDGGILRHTALPYDI